MKRLTAENFSRTQILFQLVLATGAGLVSGVLASTGRLDLVALAAGLATILAVAASRHALTYFIILGGLVGAGVAQLYIPGARPLRYVVAIAGGLLLLHSLADKLLHPQRSGGSHSVMTWALIFLGLTVGSALVNGAGPGVIATGLKNDFQMWGFFFGFATIAWSQRFLDRLPKLILFVGLVQLPFVLHQFLFLVPQRVGLGFGVVPVDVVAGTFGASLFGGGANAVLAAFQIMLVACIAGLWKHRAISAQWALLLSLALLSPIFVNEAKVSVIYLPFALMTIFYRDIIRQPLKFVGAGLLASAVLAGWLMTFTAMQGSQRIESVADLLTTSVQRQTATMAERSGPYQALSRWTALTFWSEQHAGANVAHILLGHGPGETRIQSEGLDLARTMAETRYGGLDIGPTGVSALLWETGVLGLLAFLSMLVAAFRQAGRLSKYYAQRMPWRSGLLDGIQGSIVILAVSLAHKDFIVYHLPYQTLVTLILGYVVACGRAADDSPEARDGH